MNIFFIPSWYPSVTSPIPGIFFKEQATALANTYPDLKIGISNWGQNDDRLLLWARQPWKSISKLIYKKTPDRGTITHKENLAEYFTPTYTWTEKIRRGNMKKIIEANLSNLTKFESSVGKPDLIHAHVGFPAGYIAQKVSDIQGVPYIITEQMSPFPHENFIDRDGQLDVRLANAFRHSSKNIAISQTLADGMKKFDISNLNIIPNLVNEDFFVPLSSPKTNKIFTFFSLGRMEPQKGTDILLKAFAQSNINANLRIGGDGAYLQEYKQLAIDLSIDQLITWLGELDKKTALIEYQKCDAFVLPSRHESMGVVFVEAMACGKPVIGTLCGGPEEFINETNGMLVPVEDVPSLADAMENMIKNHHLFNPQIIRRQVEQRFSSKVVCRQLRDIYEQVIKASR